MNTYWIVVADASKARLFARDKKFSDLEELETFVHPESRLQRQDLVTDRPGKKQQASKTGEYEAGEDNDPKEHEAEAFAGQLGQHLNKARAEDRFEHLVLLAEPQFLGNLRKRLDKATSDAVVGSESVNLTRAGVEEIASAADSALE